MNVLHVHPASFLLTMSLESLCTSSPIDVCLRRVIFLYLCIWFWVNCKLIEWTHTSPILRSPHSSALSLTLSHTPSLSASCSPVQRNKSSPFEWLNIPSLLCPPPFVLSIFNSVALSYFFVFVFLELFSLCFYDLVFQK